MKFSNEQILDWVSAEDVTIVGAESEAENEAARAAIVDERKKVVFDSIGNALISKRKELESELEFVNGLLHGNELVDTFQVQSAWRIFEGVGDKVSYATIKRYAAVRGLKSVFVGQALGQIDDASLGIVERPKYDYSISTRQRHDEHDAKTMVDFQALETEYLSDNLVRRSGMGPARLDFIVEILEAWHTANPAPVNQ